jgi:hypothetical protein
MAERTYTIRMCLIPLEDIEKAKTNYPKYNEALTIHIIRDRKLCRIENVSACMVVWSAVG